MPEIFGYKAQVPQGKVKGDVMTAKAGKTISLAVAMFSLLLAGASPLQAAGEDMYDYTKIPPFIEVGLNPNLLMLIDNSASMYDPAYAPANENYCFAGVDGAVSYAAYDGAVPYAGYFEPADDSWYRYSRSNERFVEVTAATAASACSSATGDKYTAADLCLTVDGVNFTAFAAKGRFLNWLAASKFDVEKEILTGGKYDSTRGQLVMESRGCLGSRFVKKVAVAKGGSTFYATFGIRPPSGYEKSLDDVYYSPDFTVSNTRIEIFKPTTAGFSFSQCQAAIDAWTDPAIGLGTLKTLTTACLEAAGTSNLTDSSTAFNHILQECWYYKAHGTWQPGAGTVASLKSDCEKVYNAASGTVAPNIPLTYQTPGSLQATDVCNGQYSTTADHTTTWGSGYVGQCWEETRSVSMINAPCPVGSPVTKATARKDANNYWYYCNTVPVVDEYTRCGNNALPSCKADDWAVWYIPDPAGGTTFPEKVQWTDDNLGMLIPLSDPPAVEGAMNQGYSCVDSSLRKYCTDTDEVTVVDSTVVNDPQGTSWGIPAVLVDTATLAQLGNPLKNPVTGRGALLGRVLTSSQPTGLIQEFKYNLRMGAMQFNPGPVSECTPIRRPDGTYKASLYDCLQDKGSMINAFSLPDTSKSNGGKVVRPIDDGDVHLEKLITAINNISATAWTPMAEAYFEAVGYFAQKNSLRLNTGDYICDQDYSSYPDWVADHAYGAGDKVRFAWDYDSNGTTDETKVYLTDAGGTSTAGAATIGDDQGVRWTPFDPVLAGCQSNNILLITDGGSTADINTTMTNFVRTAGNNDGDQAVTYSPGHLETAEYECKTTTGLSDLYGSTLLDDLSYYANRNGSAIYANPTIDSLPKQKITTYVVAAGTLQNDLTGYDCNPKTQLQEVARNSGTTLYESTNPALLEANLRKVFSTIGGEPASGSAASVISNSRSGEGAIFQAVFYPNQEDQAGREITWAGDVHALWLDERGNIREDCGTDGCAVGDEDFELDKKVDRILQFYTDPISSAARAKAFSDANGDGRADSTTPVQNDISLRDIPYIWSAGEWLSQVTEANVEIQRTYAATTKLRHILTSINGSSMIPFTAASVRAALGDNAYRGYFRAATIDEANDIIGYIRGDDTKFFPDGSTPRGYRSRLIDWFGDGTPEIWKLGDVVNSTPTVVSTPAEDYDLIYGDSSYQAFRKRYRNRRAVIYAGGNDGGLHAFNGGYYNRTTNRIDKAPPADIVGGSKLEYDLGAELWMFVPKNVLPHLKWLTGRTSGEDPTLAPPKYSHVNYVDLKPYIFDAKIFTPDDDHPQGWGTVLVGGMGFGGGNIGVDTDGNGSDDQVMRSSYFILDITNPEVAPKILREFTDPGLGYAIGTPTAIPLLLCDLKVNCPANTSVATTWPMDWYLALPSGPHDDDLPLAALNGKSDQYGKIFTLPLGGTSTVASAATPLGYAGAIGAPDATPFAIADVNFPYSFFTDVIAVDYDLDFKTDTLYFGSVAHANSDTTADHTGGMHRLVIGEDSDPADWDMNTFFKTPGNQPVSGSPSVAYDGQRAWVYFGTGRYYSAQLDKGNKAQQSYYGIKESYDDEGVMDLTSPSDGNLVDVSKVWVEKGSGELHLPSGVLFLTATDYAGPDDLDAVTSLDATTFKELNLEMSEKVSGLDTYNGWKLDFDLSGERNLGQAAILGNIVTFTTFVPSEDLCQPEGESFLWAPYYRTGTAYLKSVIGTRARGEETEVTRKISVGAGLASTPNIHSGAEAGSTAFVQTSTGAIISVQQENPGVVKSGMISWRELGE